MTFAHAITSLTLENFRNYRSLHLEMGTAPVVLRGINGAGKTNILEAISLLAPGRGFRSATLRQMDCAEAPGSAWVVAANVTTNDESCYIGTGRDPETSIEKRIIKCNGERLKSAALLTQYAVVQWITPAMDQVFVEGGSARRKLLDRITFGFVPEHAQRVTAYESAMRERTRLLTDRQTSDPYWLSVLEQQMAEHAVAITLARLEVLSKLQAVLGTPWNSFPQADISLQGTLETWLATGNSALEVESLFANRLSMLRGADAARGRATDGPHRSEWVVIHRGKQAPAERCSTGEQKALLLSIILASTKARKDWIGVPPILLLDEVIAHLDVDKRTSLFDLLKALQVQTWMTGTDAADFQGLDGFATVIEIDGGTAKIC